GARAGERVPGGELGVADTRDDVVWGEPLQLPWRGCGQIAAQPASEPDFDGAPGVGRRHDPEEADLALRVTEAAAQRPPASLLAAAVFGREPEDRAGPA